MKKIRRLAAAAVIVMSGFAAQAQAALLGFATNFPESSATASTYIFYDHDAINPTTGLLRLVAGALTLNEGPSWGNSTVTQSYFGAGDTVPDVLLSIQIRNGTGGFTAGTLVGGTVSIGFGAGAGARWDWDGNITALGFQTGTGRILDATWNFTGEQYANMPANMNQFQNGYLTGGVGFITINSSANWSANFGSDWVYGANPAANTNLNGFRTNMTSPLQINSTVVASISAIPEPATTGMMFAGLMLLGALAWARKNRK